MPDPLIDYYIERTDARFDKVEAKLDELIAFRWQIIGGSLAGGAVFSVLINVLFIVFGGH